MFADTFALSCFVPSRLDGRALEAHVTITNSYDRAGSSLAAASGSKNHGGRSDAQRAIVYLHPYPPLGGQVRNNVVHELSSRFDRRVSLTIAFNLRGAGKSEGKTSWTGSLEQEDLRTILDAIASQQLALHTQRHSPEERRSIILQMQARGFAGSEASADSLAAVPLPHVSQVLLCGYSYGSVIASSIAPSDYPSLTLDYAYVSFPYSVLWALTMHRRGQYLQQIIATVSESAVSFAKQDCLTHAGTGATAASTITVGTDSSTEVDSSSSSSNANLNGNGRDGAASQTSRTVFVAGTSDIFTSISAYDKWWSQLRSKATQAVQAALGVQPSVAGHAVDRALTTARIENADHGWLRRECEISDVIENWWWGSTA
ncbi:hypothetical protein GQ54DRAFT_297674 [Martensiomyces pterosporus]|nr:hypothetical protein GQ54DRAFT_297674 [Martensiomyces pterosporus]